MTTLKALREEYHSMDEGVRQKLIGGAAALALSMGALHSTGATPEGSKASFAATKAKMAQTSSFGKSDKDKTDKVLKVTKK